MKNLRSKVVFQTEMLIFNGTFSGVLIPLFNLKEVQFNGVCVNASGSFTAKENEDNKRNGPIHQSHSTITLTVGNSFHTITSSSAGGI